MKLPVFLCFGAVLFTVGCADKDPDVILFSKATPVTVTGYKGENLMEPFFSRDGKHLFFNNLNRAPENTNLHWATRKSDTEFEYKGEITGVNTDYVEGTPSMDKAGNLYFISNRDYNNSFSTVYRSVFSSTDGSVTSLGLVQGVSKNQAGIVNFDVEINGSGDTMYFVDGQFDDKGNPLAADLVVAKKITSNAFQRMPDSETIMKNINTDQLEYAASISSDDLQIFFTRLASPLTEASKPQLFFATRKSTSDAFEAPVQIQGLGEFVEAPSISSNGRILYYHKQVDGKYVIYLARH